MIIYDGVSLRAGIIDIMMSMAGMHRCVEEGSHLQADNGRLEFFTLLGHVKYKTADTTSYSPRVKCLTW